MNNQTMSILIIGRSGQVATALRSRSTDTHRIVALGRDIADLTDAASIEKAISRFFPSLIINAAAYTAVDQAESDEDAAFALNCHGPAKLADLCENHKIPLIHYSTDYVFDGTKEEPYVETDPTSPIGVYGRSKLAGELEITARTGRAIILRTAWVYSTTGGNFVKNMLRLASDRDRVSVVDDQVGCPTAASDIADATLRIAQSVLSGNCHYGTFHMCGSGETSWFGFAKEIFQISAQQNGPFATVVPIPTAEYPTPAKRPANSRLACEKLKTVYGIYLPTWTDSLRDCVQNLVGKVEPS